MKITVNGTTRDLPHGTTLAQIVAELATGSSGVAVAVNDAVVPRGDWTSTVLDDSDRVEILTAAQGG